MASAARNSSGINGGSCSASCFASTGDFRGKLRVKWFWLMTGLPFCSRDHAAIEHLVQNGGGDSVDEEYSRLGIVSEKLNGFLLLFGLRVFLLRLQFVATCRLIPRDHLVCCKVQKHALCGRPAGQDQDRNAYCYASCFVHAKPPVMLIADGTARLMGSCCIQSSCSARAQRSYPRTQHALSDRPAVNPALSSPSPMAARPSALSADRRSPPQTS